MREGDDQLEGLIRRAAVNDSMAMGKLYEKSLPMMMNFASHRLKTSPYLNRDPEDIVQEAWTKALRFIANVADKPNAPAHFVAFLTTTMSNMLIDEIRRKETNLQRLESDILDESRDEGLTPSRHYAAQQAFCFLNEAIKKLDPQQRDLIWHHYDDGKTYSEIADLLNAQNPMQNLTADAVRGRLNRIRAILKDEMGASTLYFLPQSNRTASNES